MNQVDIIRDKLNGIQLELQSDMDNLGLQQQEKETRELLLSKGKAAYALMVQRSKATWLREGDENKTYYHSLLRKRMYQTRVNAVLNLQGGEVQDYGGIVQHFLDYTTILGRKSVRHAKVSKEAVAMGPVLNFQQQALLIQPVTEGEIKEAVFSIHSSKSPGHDGYNSEFFKKSWEVTGSEVSCEVAEFFRTGVLGGER